MSEITAVRKELECFIDKGIFFFFLQYQLKIDEIVQATNENRSHSREVFAEK